MHAIFFSLVFSLVLLISCESNLDTDNSLQDSQGATVSFTNDSSSLQSSSIHERVDKTSSSLSFLSNSKEVSSSRFVLVSSSSKIIDDHVSSVKQKISSSSQKFLSSREVWSSSYSSFVSLPSSSSLVSSFDKPSSSSIVVSSSSSNVVSSSSSETIGSSSSNGILCSSNPPAKVDGIHYENCVVADGIEDSRDGEFYDIVYIGTQVWMAENLRYLPKVDSSMIGSEIAGREDSLFYYVYDYEPYGSTEAEEIANAKINANFKTYGVLYNFSAALAGTPPHLDTGTTTPIQGACPNDWHIPNFKDWEALIMHTVALTGLDSKSGDDWISIGPEFKKKSTLWEMVNISGSWVYLESNDTVLLGGIPAGVRQNGHPYYVSIGNISWWWSSMKGRSDHYPAAPLFPARRQLNHSAYSFNRQTTSSGDLASSIRCIKN